MNKVLRFGACMIVDDMMKMDSNLERLDEEIRHNLAHGLSREIIRALEAKDISLTMTSLEDRLRFGCGSDKYSIELMVATPEAFEAEINRRVTEKVYKYRQNVSHKLDEIKRDL